MSPEEFFDGLLAFDLGMNSGVAAVLLPKNQLGFASNATVRGTFIRPRPPKFNYFFDFQGDASAQAAVLNGLWQGGCYYAPDSGPQTLVAAISGRLFQFVPNPATLSVVVYERTGGNTQNVAAPQHWLWQSEKWVIWNDGVSLPVFFNGATTSRSIGTNTVITPFTAKTTSDFTAPPLASSPINFATDIVVVAGDSVTVPTSGNVNFQGYGLLIAFGTPSANHFNALNVSASTPTPGFIPPGTLVPAGTTFTWGTKTVTSLTQLPPGRMGAYVQGRNWMALPDEISFIASDIVGGSSGTVGEQFRDAVLNVTENQYLIGGGSFRVPGGAGKIRAIVETNVLDAALGQGPVQVHTSNRVFTCQSPVDRLTWQSLQSPILPVTVIGTGGVGQNSTVQMNGDVVYRAPNCIGSVIYARRDFDTWGNVPISREVERIIDRDDEDLLFYGTAVVFDNRMLMGCAPTTSARGVYHGGLVALNFDPLSGLAGKKPSVYDGLWPGLNPFQLITGEFSGVDRCFAFCLDKGTQQISLWEVLKSKTREIYDNGNTPIKWSFESPVMFREPDPARRKFKRLFNGELWVDQMIGTVHFAVSYRQDDYPCWTPWLEWDECAPMVNTDAKPQYRPRLPLGEPSPYVCDPSTNRPMREGYYFAVRIEITGQCRFKGARFLATGIPEPKFGVPNCKPICT